ncbi:hypothetical protein EW146_g5681 [Bondarzewia mesenterica]|uniref:Uncharacterized protein n=1 Tax=Bondarzewia mesenterica TaxID=1095465 RepID=A0A4S4LRR1_9AGAM|nr:hypothetical protein EW146_g5681 [Bondarzewia mesenterica]
MEAPNTRDTLEVTQRKLHGRFLHITDMHPDPYYHTDASQSSACHRRKPKKDKDRSGYYGTPYRLTNLTLDFLEKNWASEIDFVLWTGDNARHDNDRKLPRTLNEIYDLNRAVATKMESIFLKREIPVVPSLGPNNIISQYSSLWKAFVPFPSYQVFQRGAYFSVEVIPNAVAAISLNTMYFYDSNKAVGGCEYNDPNDPGNLQFDWLEVQLELFRERGMQVWMSGHVPPSPGNYFPECYVRYVELSLRYQDTILGHIYGHMNNDYFFFLEADDLQFPSDGVGVEAVGDGPAASAHDELFDMLLKDFSELPKNAKKVNFDDYGVVNVSPSVVPNPYLPSFRIFSYNVTGADAHVQRVKKGSKRKHGHRRGGRSRETLCKKAGYRNSWRCQLREPWYSDPESPSRRNTLWTPLGYAQYYLKEKKLLNKTRKPKFKLEYLTYALEALLPEAEADKAEEFNYPVPIRHLPESLRNGNRTQTKYAPYGMKDLTIPSWIKLAQKLGDEGRGKLRRRFKKYMYMA